MSDSPSPAPAPAPLVSAAGDRRSLDARHLLGLLAVLTALNAVGLAGGTLIPSVHGTGDTVIPFRHGEALAAALGARARFVRLDGREHNDVFNLAGDRILAETLKLAVR